MSALTVDSEMTGEESLGPVPFDQVFKDPNRHKIINSGVHMWEAPCSPLKQTFDSPEFELCNHKWWAPLIPFDVLYPRHISFSVEGQGLVSCFLILSRLSPEWIGERVHVSFGIVLQDPNDSTKRSITG